MKNTRLHTDVISGLPGNIIDTILIHLPIREAVRTSILSKNWRYAWATISKLAFDEKLCEGSSEIQLSTKTKLVLAILQVLLLHKGTIAEFSLFLDTVETFSEIDQAVIFLSRRGDLKKFTLNISKGEGHILPSTIFSFHQLSHLDLKNCAITPPVTINGFSRLISLKFEEVAITGEVLKEIISNCPMLESITINTAFIDYMIFHHHESNAPRPKHLCLDYPFEDDLEDERLEERKSYFIELFGFLSSTIEDLSLGFSFFHYLAAGTELKKLPTTLVHLKVITLNDICVAKLNDIAFVLCLIRSSPNLKILELKLSIGGTGDSIQPQEYVDVSLQHLVEVKIKLVCEMLSVYNFVKFLLATSPALVRMRIAPHPLEVTDKGLWLMKHIIQFPRASPQASIIFEECPLPW